MVFHLPIYLIFNYYGSLVQYPSTGATVYGLYRLWFLWIGTLFALCNVSIRIYLNLLDENRRFFSR